MIENRGIVINPNELDETWLNRCRELNPVGGQHADESLRALLEQRERPRPLLDRACEMGISIEYEMHAFSYLMPKALFETHPDWFCMNAEGARSRDCLLQHLREQFRGPRRAGGQR